MIFESIVGYSGYWILCWTTPVGKLSKLKLGSPEMNSYGERSDTRSSTTSSKENTAHGEIHGTRR